MRAVFLDRDGVINANVVRDGKPVAPTSVDDFRIFPGVEDAVRGLKDAGYLIVVVTNQPDVRTGRTSRETLEAMHAEIRRRMPVDDILACFHTDADNCGCRKPKPGLLTQAAAKWGIDLKESFMIGDRWRDVEAGQAVGCLTFLVDYGYEQEKPCNPDFRVGTLAEAAKIILASGTRGASMRATNVEALKIKIFADGADIENIKTFAKNPLVKGFTTNPTLMRQAGVSDYKAFALEALKVVPDRPISFEVFADDLPTMEQQAREIATWGRNVYVKIPVMNTKTEFTGPILSSLSKSGIKLNVTAIMTVEQVSNIADALADNVPAVISVFAGRIADTGRDPIPLMTECLKVLQKRPQAELLWASPREVLNIFQGDDLGCHIITVTPDHLKKLSLVGKNLDEYSRETVNMFYKDAQSAGYTIALAQQRAAS